MAKYTLNIETDDAVELRDIVDRIAAATAHAVVPQITDAVTQAAPEKPAAPKPGKAKPAPKVEAPATLPTVEEATAAADATDGYPVEPKPAPVVTPAGDVSYDAVKQALITLMDKKSASVVQAMLKEKFGVVAISQLNKAQYGEALAALTEWAA